MAVQVKDAGSRQLEKKRFWKEVGRQKVLLIWAAVFVVYGFVFCYLPLAGWLMAFQNYKPKDGLFGSQFVGLAKFQQLFSDDTFPRRHPQHAGHGRAQPGHDLRHGPSCSPSCSTKWRTVWWKKTIQTISYLPHFLSWIIVTGILHDALSSTGIVNELLVNLGIFETELNFFAYPKYFWGIVAFANVWKETGWNAIIYLAAITSIDPSLYEAASIDGAGRFAKIWNITLPGHPLHHHDPAAHERRQRAQRRLRSAVPARQRPGAERVPDHRPSTSSSGGISQGDYAIGTAAGIFKSVVSIVLIVAANMFAKRNRRRQPVLRKEVRTLWQKEKELKAKPIHYRATVSNTLFVALNTLFMVLFVIITLYPVLNTLAISFNDGTDALRGGIYLLPRKWSTQNYVTVLQKDNLITGAYISVLRTVIGTLTALAANALLAFIVSRKRFLFRPSALAVLGHHDVRQRRHDPDLPALQEPSGSPTASGSYIIPGMVSAFNMLVLRTYMEGIPESLEESAQLDGAGLHDHLCQDHLPAVPAGLRHGRPVRGGSGSGTPGSTPCCTTA